MNVSRCSVSPGVWFGSRRVSIGAGTFINYDCMFNTAAQISIGSNCDIGMGALFITGSHEMNHHTRRAGAAIASPIIVSDGVWIGARVTILPGTVIGRGAVIGAGAVVRGEVEPNAVYAGVPATKIRDLSCL
ncbi:acyltransferase [Rhodococcus jostii]|uniref:acyltransferase n=1 Tax=Rhodococcus jostii TaxID=132919 RepID=UPI00364725D2